VTPGSFFTSALRVRVSLLNNVDLPTFGCPSRATNPVLLLEDIAEFLHDLRILEPILRCRDVEFEKNLTARESFDVMSSRRPDLLHNPRSASDDDCQMTLFCHQNLTTNLENRTLVLMVPKDSNRASKWHFLMEGFEALFANDLRCQLAFSRGRE